MLSVRSLIATAGGDNRLGRGAKRLQLRDLNAYLAGNVNEVLPGESVRPLRGELVAERDRIMVVEQDEVVANGKLEEGLHNEPMFHGARNGTHVHDLVLADEVFS